MKSNLYDYQKRIVKEQSKNKSCNLFMSMGTGKTITSLALFEQNPTHKILIICLVSKMKDWQEDLLKELNIHSIILDKGTKKNQELLAQNCSAYIINFESAWRLTDLLKWVDNDTTVLVDESHKMKSPTSSIGKFMQKLAKCTQYKLILTGTPQSQGYIDYYNQLYFTDTWNMKFANFKNTFCIYEKRYYNGFMINTLVGYRKKDFLDKFINSNCVFYERKVDDDMIPTDIKTTFDKPKIYDKFKKIRVYEDVVADTIGKLFVSLRTICSGNIEENEVDNQKIKWLDDFLDCINDRLVIFYNFNVERDRIIKLLESKKIKYSEYSGRIKDFTEFKNNEKSVAICQYKSASTGLNDLCIANKCVFYSLPLEYIDYAQSKKRIDRIGQTRKPLFYYLICKGTIEEKIYEKLKEGKSFDDKMFDAYLNNAA